MIELVELTKKFRYRDKENKLAWKTAVDGLNVSVNRGEIFGLLGPNGAGKTTTIRMLTLQTIPTSGEIWYDGRLLTENEQELKQWIGVVPQHINFDQYLTVGENLELHGRLHHMDEADRRKRIHELLRYTELTEVINDNVRRLSGGMKRRLLIARALMHRPRILFMDEPTVALDPQVRHRIWELIRQMSKEGTTVVLTTHYIEEAENLCSRVAVMHKGELAALDTPETLCTGLGQFTVEWDASDGRSCRFFQTKAEAVAFAGGLTDSLRIRPTNLEDVFIELTGRREGL